jgi:predicted nucleic acid-binding protein
MTLCVLDDSVALAWAFEDETSTYAEKVIDAIQVHRATVPPIWPLEVTNAMIGAVRRRYQEADATRFLELLNTIQLDVDPERSRLMGTANPPAGPVLRRNRVRRELPGVGGASRSAIGHIG